jgi:hypothetical protein
MKSRTVILLAAVAVVVAGAAWLFSRPPASVSEAVESARGTLVFPDLAAHLAQASEVDITNKGHTLVIRRQGAVWGLPDRGGYPVQTRRLRELLTGLTLLRITEPRTKDPRLLESLGLGNPESPTSTANLVRVRDAKGDVLAALVVGHRRVYTQGDMPDSVYIRRPGEDQSWLAEGRIPTEADPQLWLQRQITDIDPAEVASVVVHRGDSVLRFGRVDGKEALLQPAGAPPLDRYRLGDVFRALQTLTLDDVKPAGSSPAPVTGDARFTLVDGTTITVSVFAPTEPAGVQPGAETVWIQLAVSGNSAQAQALASRLTGWSYQVGSWKEKAFVPLLSDLILKPAVPPAAK